jgi:hypothetical protein
LELRITASGDFGYENYKCGIYKKRGLAASISAADTAENRFRGAKESAKNRTRFFISWHLMAKQIHSLSNILRTSALAQLMIILDKG